MRHRDKSVAYARTVHGSPKLHATKRSVRDLCVQSKNQTVLSANPAGFVRGLDTKCSLFNASSVDCPCRRHCLCFERLTTMNVDAAFDLDITCQSKPMPIRTELTPRLRGRAKQIQFSYKIRSLPKSFAALRRLPQITLLSPPPTGSPSLPYVLPSSLPACSPSSHLLGAW